MLKYIQQITLGIELLNTSDPLHRVDVAARSEVDTAELKKRPGRREFPQEFSVAVEYLDALIDIIGNVHVTVRTYRHSARIVKLSVSGAGFTEGEKKVPVAVELQDAFVKFVVGLDFSGGRH